MAYDSNNLSAMSYANGATWWDYKNTDEWDGPLSPGYFDAANAMLRPGDFMVIRRRMLDDSDGHETCIGWLCIVHRVTPHVVLHRIGD